MANGRRPIAALKAMAAAAAASLLLASAASAAPGNDDFADAQEIAPLPSTTTADNTDATVEPGEPSESGGPANTVWFKWTAASSGPVHLDICDSTISPGARFYVFTGSSLGDLDQIAKNSFWSTEDCAQTFEVLAGTTYYLQVGSVGDTGQFDLAARSADPPANDNFANAETIAALPKLIVGHTEDAAAEVGEPNHEYYAAPTKSLWYRWTAPFSGEVDLEPNCGGVVNEGPTVSVYTGTGLDNLTRVSATVCYSTFNVTAGTTYWFAASAFHEAYFSFRLLVRIGDFWASNDFFAAPRALAPGLPASSNGSTEAASAEEGEPDHVQGLEAFTSAWYQWTATTTGLVSVDTCVSDFDSVLAVYVGSTLSGLARASESDDADVCDTRTTNPYGSSATFQAFAGSTYRFAVDGYDAGVFALDLDAAGPQVAPPAPPSVPGSRKKAQKVCPKRRTTKKSALAAKRKCGKKRKKKR